MALSYGFYNSLDEDRRYNSEQISKIFDGLITDGVYASIGKSLLVRLSEDEKNIIIGPGRAWFNHTWTYNDSDYILYSDDLFPAPPYGLKLYAVVLEIDRTKRVNAFKVLEGGLVAVNGTPEKPTLLKGEGGVYQYPLAYVTRRYSQELESPIRDSDIENTVGTEACPFVESIVTPAFTLDDILSQWIGKREDLAGDSIRELNLARAELEDFMNVSKNEVLSWFENLQVQMEGDVAVNLQNQIGALENLKTSMKVSLVEAINSSLLITKKKESEFKGILYGTVYLQTEKDIAISLPVNCDYITSNGVVNPSVPESVGVLRQGDVIFCRIRKSEYFKKNNLKTCRPIGEVVVLDDSGKPVRPEASWLDPKYPIQYISYRTNSNAEFNGTYPAERDLSSIPYLYGESDTPRIFWDGNEPKLGSKEFLNGTEEGFTILQFAGLRPINKNGNDYNAYIFLDLLNNATPVVDRLSEMIQKPTSSATSHITRYIYPDVSLASAGLVLDTLQHAPVYMNGKTGVISHTKPVYNEEIGDWDQPNAVVKLEPEKMYEFKVFGFNKVTKNFDCAYLYVMFLVDRPDEDSPYPKGQIHNLYVYRISDMAWSFTWDLNRGVFVPVATNNNIDLTWTLRDVGIVPWKPVQVNDYKDIIPLLPSTT